MPREKRGGLRTAFHTLGRNGDPTEAPLIFWWEGPDGTRLMTMYWGGYYGIDLLPPEGWPHKSWRLTFLEPEGKVGYRWGLIWSLSPG